MTASPYSSVLYHSLKGRHVVITGGASGIGAAMVEAFCVQGARVSFLDIAEAEGRALASATGASFHPCDITDLTLLQQTIKTLGEAPGGLDVLVNNAGNDQREPFEEVTPGSWHRLLALNLDHQFFATQAAVPFLTRAEHPGVIMLGSVSWMRGRPGMTAYTSSKAAINGLTRTLARELGPRGIRVNCIVPGAIVTPRQTAKWITPEMNQEFLALQALKFRLDVSHVARLALYLASTESAGSTGANFIVDAGITQN
ncbi:MAG: SDR family oxidoreductase [Hyphomicrobiales bacterium]|nr:SDR family oxidoreductase [Hyphomicrobiales bacterium]